MLAPARAPRGLEGEARGVAAVERRAQPHPTRVAWRRSGARWRAASRRRRSSSWRRSGSSRSAPCPRGEPWSCARRRARARAPSSSSATALAKGLVSREADMLAVQRHVDLQSLRAGGLGEATQAEVLEHPLQQQRDPAALEDRGGRARDRGRRRARSDARSRWRARAACAARSRRGSPARRASADRRRACSRSACSRSAIVAVRTHSGRCAGDCFWKKDLPSTPSGQRVTVSARPARWASRTGASVGVVVDQLALGESAARIEHLVRGWRASARALNACLGALGAPREIARRRVELAPAPSSCVWAAGRRSSLAHDLLRPPCLRAGPCRRAGAGCPRWSTARTPPRRPAWARRRRRRAAVWLPGAKGEFAALERREQRPRRSSSASLKPLPTRPTKRSAPPAS